MNIYVETVVSRKMARNPQKIQKFFFVLGWILLALGFLVIFWFFLPAIVAWFCYLVSLWMLEVDYEYIQTNEIMDIDFVMGNRGRRRLASFDLNDVILVAPWDSEELEEYMDIKPTDVSARDPYNRPYVMILESAGEVKKIYMQLDEKILNSMSRIIPNRIIMKQ